LLRHLKNKGVGKISFKKINGFMTNSQRQQFDYEVFTAAYDSDPRLQNIVSDFDQNSVELKQNETDDLDVPDDTGDTDSVSQMAQNATDLGN